MLKKIVSMILLYLVSSLLLAQDLVPEKDTDLLYVTDKLRLSLYQRPDANSQVIKLLSSGDALRVEERSGPYVFVTAPGDIKGWVKRGFLVSTPTSNLLLAQEISRTEDLQAQVDRLANSKIVIDQYERDMDAMVEKMDLLQKEKDKAATAMIEAQKALEDSKSEVIRQQHDQRKPSRMLIKVITEYWKVLGSALVALFLLSFLLSKKFVEFQIKKKFHGIKIW